MSRKSAVMATRKEFDEVARSLRERRGCARGQRADSARDKSARIDSIATDAASDVFSDRNQQPASMPRPIMRKP